MIMKVYIVMEEDLYAGDIEGPIIWNVDRVYNTREHAQAYINSRKNYFKIEERILFTDHGLSNIE